MTQINVVDAEVGARIRTRRKRLGLTQERFAEALGITFQQVQKYERGTNRVSAGRLFAMKQILDVPVSYFFGDSASLVDSDDQMTDLIRHLQQVDCIKLNEAFLRINDNRLRKMVVALVGSIGDAPQSSEA